MTEPSFHSAIGELIDDLVSVHRRRRNPFGGNRARQLEAGARIARDMARLWDAEEERLRRVAEGGEDA